MTDRSLAERRYMTLFNGDDDYTITSRSLARKLLFNHLMSLDIPVHTFLDTADPAWLSYQRHKKVLSLLEVTWTTC